MEPGIVAKTLVQSTPWPRPGSPRWRTRWCQQQSDPVFARKKAPRPSPRRSGVVAYSKKSNETPMYEKALLKKCISIAG